MDKTSGSTCFACSNDPNRVTPVNVAGQFYGRETTACASSNALPDAQPGKAPDDGLRTGLLARTDQFYFANDPATRQGIIDQLRQQRGRVVCTNSPSDLEKHGLMQQIWPTASCTKQLAGSLRQSR